MDKGKIHTHMGKTNVFSTFFLVILIYCDAFTINIWHTELGKKNIK